MLIVENIRTYGWESAIHGMRNPMNSWSQSDSKQLSIPPEFRIGSKDMQLCKKLIVAGSDHRKFLRQIFISMDITAPLYWWKEFDTYKVGTVANSCSTMHKLCSKSITIEDFSFEDDFAYMFKRTVEDCEWLRQKFIETNDKKYWRALIQLLPESYNQTRTVTMNYEVAMKIFFARRYHKLIEWHVLCNTFVNDLPYFRDFFFEDDKNES